MCHCGQWLRTTLGVWMENLSLKIISQGREIVVEKYLSRCIREMLILYQEK